MVKVGNLNIDSYNSVYTTSHWRGYKEDTKDEEVKVDIVVILNFL